MKTIEMTITNKKDLRRSKWVNKAFEKISHRISNEYEYPKRVVMTEQDFGHWTVDYLGVTVLIEDPDRNDLWHVRIKFEK